MITATTPVLLIEYDNGEPWSIFMTSANIAKPEANAMPPRSTPFGNVSFAASFMKAALIWHIPSPWHWSSERASKMLTNSHDSSPQRGSEELAWGNDWIGQQGIAPSEKSGCLSLIRMAPPASAANVITIRLRTR
jgi:hypothetical protein